jgi:hypothetical protein
MALEFKSVPRPTELLCAIVCSRCKKRIEAADDLQAQEVFSATWIGGFASVWGDGSMFRIDLCQHCHLEVLGPFAERVNE